MNTEEARQKLEDVAGNFYLARTSILEAADAYALQAHVDACAAMNSEKALCGTAWRGMVWYCDKGKEIEALR